MDYEGLSDFEQTGSPLSSPVSPKTSLGKLAVRAATLGSHLRTSVDWTDLKLSKPLLRALADLGFEQPTPIQRDAIPHALAGRDVLGRAETGSGKTGAFLLPTIDRLLQSTHVKKRKLNLETGEIRMASGSAVSKVLVLLPTRELAAQCFKACELFTKYCPITRCLITGGVSQKQQEKEMRANPDIVIATPGRCLDLLLNSASIHMDLLDIVIFDEADKLVEMGFKDECLAVLSHCSRSRQTLLFSATLNSKSSDLIKLALRDPVSVPKDATGSAPATIARCLQQAFFSITSEEERLPTLINVLETETANSANKKVICFFNTKKTVHKLSLVLRFSEIRLPNHCELHGNLSQEQRMQALQEFDNGTATLMLCTDIAGRGLDLDNVDLVVNGEVPEEATKYVHRIGRTGRRGLDGNCITIFNQNSERQKLKEIVKAVSGKKIDFSSDRIDSKNLARVSRMIDGAMTRVKEMLKLENAERGARVAEARVTRDQNCVLYSDEIRSRPAKRWVRKEDETHTQKKKNRSGWKNECVE
eukprot:Gregarina_sp_Poly_1__7166@NODE_392_length_8959_cov_63_078835_g321_i0_p1_GENE_NODE_392_length_8959_cov_63_078835_g321_i0NODE_392_length_8959_cov_63_078835_g321_i0_p1_ORF_typecomplete_len532_score99_59DEAD/PF00270_29/5_1e48DEAD/PF00270_29/2_5e02Helicase_C/PF00271_31/1_7Helicase_C/PF00271_31/4_5e26ResIII/PF04851_15/6_6e14ResIII/PF04851_15/2_8e03ERCC3_RAD25_C/PF16203_5/3e05UTP25/PF06862_12/3_4UTP25/PF06862_12/0_007Flavi_DEAD/PF07652_14/1_3e02Flavi_DEAD/PF07652_14/0_059AAA_19/PF13245_6/0_09AAA_19/PF1